ncbi:MAG: binding-protein-dependent transport system inner rane component [Lachnospiraceae bacterium]|nr:binding-protein-dependent transport system inner rane component [Lachnospiraceae bacterium]
MASRKEKHTDGLRKMPARPWSKHFKRYWQLYAMMLLPILYIIIFKYIPMFGNILAFRRYRPGMGPYGVSWVGFRKRSA